MMALPEVPKGFLVSTRSSLDEIIFAGNHYISFYGKLFSVEDIRRRQGKRFRFDYGAEEDILEPGI
jgi:hypothetical protein